MTHSRCLHRPRFHHHLKPKHMSTTPSLILISLLHTRSPSVCSLPLRSQPPPRPRSPRSQPAVRALLAVPPYPPRRSAVRLRESTLSRPRPKIRRRRPNQTSRPAPRRAHQKSLHLRLRLPAQQRQPHHRLCPRAQHRQPLPPPQRPSQTPPPRCPARSRHPHAGAHPPRATHPHPQR